MKVNNGTNNIANSCGIKVLLTILLTKDNTHVLWKAYIKKTDPEKTANI